MYSRYLFDGPVMKYEALFNTCFLKPASNHVGWTILHRCDIPWRNLMPIRKGGLSRKLNQLNSKKEFHSVISGEISPAALLFSPLYVLHS